MENDRCGNCNHIGINIKKHNTRHCCNCSNSIYFNCIVRFKDLPCTNYFRNVNSTYNPPNTKQK
jgi:hypothetical protein